MNSPWYDHASGIIQRVIRQGQRDGLTPSQIRAAIRQAYPYGIRQYWPYRVWIRAQQDRLVEAGMATERQERAWKRALKRRESRSKRRQEALPPGCRQLELADILPPGIQD